MKAIFTILFLTVTLFSCKKEISFSDSHFAGVWELEASSGFAGVIHYPPGNGNIIVLGPTGHFERRDHNTVVFEGRYSIKKQKVCNGEKRLFLITSDDPNPSTTVIDVVGGKLQLSASAFACVAADMGGSSYRKL